MARGRGGGPAPKGGVRVGGLRLGLRVGVYTVTVTVSLGYSAFKRIEVFRTPAGLPVLLGHSSHPGRDGHAWRVNFLY